MMENERVKFLAKVEVSVTFDSHDFESDDEWRKFLVKYSPPAGLMRVRDLIADNMYEDDVIAAVLHPDTEIKIVKLEE